ncbi:MAG: hypothetical protein J6U01_06110 [Clostridia bacterium]|nr:hypothetical protein [Clostridia bacterium]
MRTDIIAIDNQGTGFTEVMDHASRAAQYSGLNGKEALQLEIMTEELLSLTKSVTGEMKAQFWIDITQKLYELHLTTETDMTREKRTYLLQTATSGKNEAAQTFLGMLRNVLDEARLPSQAKARYQVSDEVLSKVMSHQVLSAEELEKMDKPVEIPKWDGYEKSILQHVSDSVRIAIRGGVVDITVVKQF